MLYNETTEKRSKMEIKIKSYSSQSSLLSSILFFILGAILFTSADKLLNIISIIIGTLFATAATISLIIYFIQARKLGGIPKRGNLTFGIVSLILAIIFIFFSNIVEQAIRFIVGGWILLTGIIRLINVISMPKKDSKFIQLLVVAVLLIFIGIYTIVVEIFGLDIIGIIMMAYAGIEIVGYILSEDPTYITTYNNARSLIRRIDRDELLQVLVKSYLDT